MAGGVAEGGVYKDTVYGAVAAVQTFMHLMGALPAIGDFPLAYSDHPWSGQCIAHINRVGDGYRNSQGRWEEVLLLLNVQKGAIFLPRVYSLWVWGSPCVCLIPFLLKFRDKEVNSSNLFSAKPLPRWPWFGVNRLSTHILTGPATSGDFFFFFLK